jgi:deazaflavin-dependent oxidoreductase (nitroreductase family)
MPADRAPHLLNDVHRRILKLTRGRIGWHAYGMPMLELTTIGRKSGEDRTTMLSSPLQRGETIVIVASRGGSDGHPAWYLNLVEEPRVRVNFRGRGVRDMRARVADSAERAELWPLVTKDHANYAGYQRKTDREIPLVLLEPVRAD